MSTKSNDIIAQNKVFLWIALATTAVLSIPFLAMQLRWEGWEWELGDFIVMGTLLLGSGFLFVLVARTTPRKYRVLIGLAFFAALLLTWVHLAVGIVDSWPLAGS